MGKRGPKAALGRPKKAQDYTRIDFDNPLNPEEEGALKKLQAMKPRERMEFLASSMK